MHSSTARAGRLHNVLGTWSWETCNADGIPPFFYWSIPFMLAGALPYRYDATGLLDLSTLR